MNHESSLSSPSALEGNETLLAHKVYIKETPEMNVYVMSYGGWMSTMTDKQKSNELSSALDKDNAKYKKEHCSAGYNR